MGVNVIDNRVDITMTPTTRANELDRTELPSTVRVDRLVRVGTSTANSYGGLTLSDGCTTGWSVKKGVTFGVVTAGHCPNTQQLNGTNLPYQGGLTSGSHDEQWHTTPGFTDVAQFNAGAGPNPIRSVHSIKLRANQAINSYLCKNGATTGYRCGYLVQKDFQPSWITNANPTFHKAQPNGGPDMSNDGDSGGPVFLDYSAWGIVSGQWGFPWCICDLVYTPIDYVQSGPGITILTV